jgi:hypothetical protein
VPEDRWKDFKDFNSGGNHGSKGGRESEHEHYLLLDEDDEKEHDNMIGMHRQPMVEGSYGLEDDGEEEEYEEEEEGDFESGYYDDYEYGTEEYIASGSKEGDNCMEYELIKKGSAFTGSIRGGSEITIGKSPSITTGG